VQTPIYTGPAIVSEQFEGQCGHELWYFAPGFGLVKIESPYDGGQIKGDPVCMTDPTMGDHVLVHGAVVHDPKLTIVRTH
jgi:hypothetical protein